jgi:molecular chaperone DnaK
MTKINYGIDLGTTNSAIARMEKGKPTIIKNDFSGDTMPSCVGFNKKGRILGGDAAKQSLHQERVKAIKSKQKKHSNYFVEFKRTMGTDETYYSPNADQSFNSEQLSAEVLKKLRSFVTDEDFQSAIVTVPAKFDIGQKDATLRAAKLAGIEQCELLQEPIAASMAYGLDTDNKNGFWVVFDFGGGTFDAALVKVEEGIMKVVDTEGDNHLGGKNLDLAIVDEVIIPYLQAEYSIDSIMEDEVKRSILQNAMKGYAEEAKIQLSFQEEYNILSDLGDIPGEDDDGEEFELDITLKREELKKIIGPIFQRAIDLTQNLLQRNNLAGNQLDALILVGGPTHSPILREMLEDQVIQPDTSVEPMTAIATGAALYASTIDVSDAIQEASRDKTKIQLDLGYEATSVETEEMVAIKILPDKTEGEIPSKVFAELGRGDKAWSSGKVEINEKGEVIEVQLNEGKPNEFEVFLYDEAGKKLEGQPDHFTIIQGMGGTDSAATLPQQIGVELDKGKEYPVFGAVKGLEKNVTLPATGTVNGLKTKQDIRPGMNEDKIKIGLYQGESDSQDTRAIYNRHIYDAVITGDDLPALLPKNSDVDLTITTDKSGRIEKLEAYFPYLETSKEIPIPEQAGNSVTEVFLANEMERANKTISRLKSNELVNQEEVKNLEKELEYQEKRFEQGKSDVDRRQEVFGNLQDWFRKADGLESNVEWPNLEKQLRAEFQRLEKAHNELGDEKTTKHVDELKQELDQVIRDQNIERGQELLEKIQNLHFQITFVYQLIGFVRHHDENFDNFQWTDRHQARAKIDEAKSVIAENPTKERLHPVVMEIINLLPASEVEDSEVGTEILRKSE